jgi:hypothetical protein
MRKWFSYFETISHLNNNPAKFVNNDFSEFSITYKKRFVFQANSSCIIWLGSFIWLDLTCYLKNILNELVQLSILELSIINFGDMKIKIKTWFANSIQIAQANLRTYVNFQALSLLSKT